MSIEPKSDSRQQAGARPDAVSAEAANQIVEPGLRLELDGFPLETKAQLVTAMFSMTGPLPPPALAREYEDICPGFVDRSLRIAEKAQDAAIEAAQDERRKNQIYRLIGMICAAILSFSLIMAGTYIAVNANVYIGALTALVSFIGSVVVAFINGRPLRDQSPMESDKKISDQRAAGNKQPPSRKKRR